MQFPLYHAQDEFLSVIGILKVPSIFQLGDCKNSYRVLTIGGFKESAIGRKVTSWYVYED